MGYCRQSSLPGAEPVSLYTAKTFLSLPQSFVDMDSILTGFITAARELGEILTNRSLAQRTFTQVLDSHPYYTDTIQSQLAYPPSYYSLPRYSTTLWNYSQMIKLGFSPVISVESMVHIGTDGMPHELHQDVDFVLDRISEPARIFPKVGLNWPADLYVANAVVINFTAGYDSEETEPDKHHVAASPPNQQPDSVIITAVPQSIIMAILHLVAYWFNNRGSAGKIPEAIEQAFLNNAVVDFAPTRG